MTRRAPTPLRPERGKKRTPRPRNLKHPAYLDFVRTLRCVCCQREGLTQLYSTEAAHAGPRGLAQKSADTTAIPLCANHHTNGKDSAHRLGKNFAKHWGLNIPALVRQLQKQYEEQRGS